MGSRRRAVRAVDVKIGADALRAAGLTPTALDIAPDGTMRWHFTPVADNDELAIDREFARLEAQLNGHGRA
ncbi:MAG: hypothetical protein J0H08_09700 [Rhizobiales bacterium]|nr:hypothetical protein [Hyphomicrobiales bacterium]